MIADEAAPAIAEHADGLRRSVFYLPKPRPLDHLVGTLFAGPTLVLNGALDPLQKAVDRAEVTGCLSVLSLCRIELLL